METPFIYKAVDALLSLKTLLSAQAAQKPTHWKDLLTLLVLPSVRLNSVHESPENSASKQDCEEAHLKEEWMLKSRLTAVTKAKICSQLCFWLATSLLPLFLFVIGKVSGITKFFKSLGQYWTTKGYISLLPYFTQAAQMPCNLLQP